MKPIKPAARKASGVKAKSPAGRAIIRAVASSTAIETGQSIGQIERTLLRSSKGGKFCRITLAS